MDRVHCWQGRVDPNGFPVTGGDGMSVTCMLWDAHEGPHEWTRDDQISFIFERAQEGS